MATERSFKGKNVIVTGGALGIGFEIGKTFLKKGARRLAILDVNQTAAEKSVKTLQVEFGSEKVVCFKIDVCNNEDLDETFNTLIKEWKQVDVLVNNAGVEDDSHPDRVLDINLSALVKWSLKYWNYMRKDRGGNGGTIVNISSVLGFRAVPFFPIYTATKFGVYGFTKSLGHKYNYDRTGVRVIALCPGYTHTSLSAAEPSFFEDSVKLNTDYKQVMKTRVAIQNVEVVGTAAAEMFETADSGTTWCVEDSKPIYEV